MVGYNKEALGSSSSPEGSYMVPKVPDSWSSILGSLNRWVP